MPNFGTLQEQIARGQRLCTMIPQVELDLNKAVGQAMTSLQSISRKLTALRSEQKINYGHVGNAGHAAQILRELDSFL